MTKSPKQKLRILYLMQILMRESDEEHGLTMIDIIDRLDEMGIRAERRAIYDDIKLLREFDIDIITRKSKTTEYFIGCRDFEYQEVALLIDAVQSSKFLTAKKCASLSKKLLSLTSIHEGKKLNREVHVAGRIKSQSESIYYVLDDIQYAISQKRQISFKYYDYNLEKKRVARKGGKTYFANPIGLTYVDDNYYLISYNVYWKDFVTYRVDRMMNVMTLDEPAEGLPPEKKIDLSEYVNRAFSMFVGEKIGVVLVFHKDMMNAIIDRFGKDVLVQKLDDKWARAHISITKSAPFFAWLTQFEGKIRIEKPESLVDEYLEYLENIMRAYDSGVQEM